MKRYAVYALFAAVLLSIGFAGGYAYSQWGKPQIRVGVWSGPNPFYSPSPPKEGDIKDGKIWMPGAVGFSNKMGWVPIEKLNPISWAYLKVECPKVNLDEEYKAACEWDPELEERVDYFLGVHTMINHRKSHRLAGMGTLRHR